MMIASPKATWLLLVIVTVLGAHCQVQANPLQTWDYGYLRSLRETIASSNFTSASLSQTVSTSLYNLRKTTEPEDAPVLLPINSKGDAHLPPGATARHFVTLVPYAHPCNNYPPGCKDYDKKPPSVTCKNETGLPWVICDDMINREAASMTDRPPLEDVARYGARYSLAAYLFRCPKRAAIAASYFRMWFVDDQTSMLPTLRYAQAIPGVVSGKHSGAIDLSIFERSLSDALMLMHINPAAEGIWTEADHTALQRWCREMADHLIHDEQTSPEGYSPNNHGVFYDATVISLLLLADDGIPRNAVFRDLFNPSCKGYHWCYRGRLDQQLDKDGAYKHEISRAGKVHYVWYTLLANAHLVAEAQAAGATTGCSDLMRATEWILAHLDELTSEGADSYLIFAPQSLRMISNICNEPQLEEVACKVLDVIGKEKDWVLWNYARFSMDIYNVVFPSRTKDGGNDCDVWKRFPRYEQEALPAPATDAPVQAPTESPTAEEKAPPVEPATDAPIVVVEETPTESSAQEEQFESQPQEEPSNSQEEEKEGNPEEPVPTDSNITEAEPQKLSVSVLRAPPEMISIDPNSFLDHTFALCLAMLLSALLVSVQRCWRRPRCKEGHHQK